MIEFLQFMFQCARAYQQNRGTIPGRGQVSYFAVSRHQVPQLTVLIGRGRDAWVISALALENGFTAGTWRPRP